MRHICLVCIALVATTLGGTLIAAPLNMLWITAEDMSPVLGCYGDDYARTPNIDRLATQSVRYRHAFASAPVCSPARSCLITGCYATSLGTHQMRSAVRIPDQMKGFPALLRNSGYYTSNNVKTDYNTANWQQIVAASWNDSSNSAHWRNRRNPESPFFSVFNLMTSHQSRAMVWPRERFVAEVQSRLEADEIHDPQQAPVPPYYPDTPVIRRTIARFYDCVTAMDKQVGRILEQLENDGLADDTIVFFYSDHGSGMPRHKRALLDSGMHVPLLIRFPTKYQHLAPARPGETTDRLVSFVDFGPTVLSLAGVNIPNSMQGQPFLGKHHANPREFAFGHRDRVDEVSDLARSVRDHRYLYIRNYMPHLGYNQFTAWPDQGEIRHEIYRLADRKTMTAPQWHFAGPQRPVEELYDCEKDPQNLHNLAGSSAHLATLQRMRAAHRQHIRDSHDIGFLPESETWKSLGGETAWDFGRRNRPLLESWADVAAKVGVVDESELLANLSSQDGAGRYWAAVGLSARETISADAVKKLEVALGDNFYAARIESANALARHGQLAKSVDVLIAALNHEDLAVVLQAARTIELLGDAARKAIPAMRRIVARAESIRPADTPATVVQSGDQDLAMFIGFAANGFLSRSR